MLGNSHHIPMEGRGSCHIDDDGRSSTRPLRVVVDVVLLLGMLVWRCKDEEGEVETAIALFIFMVSAKPAGSVRKLLTENLFAEQRQGSKFEWSFSFPLHLSHTRRWETETRHGRCA